MSIAAACATSNKGELRMHTLTQPAHSSFFTLPTGTSNARLYSCLSLLARTACATVLSPLALQMAATGQQSLCTSCTRSVHTSGCSAAARLAV